MLINKELSFPAMFSDDAGGGGSPETIGDDPKAGDQTGNSLGQDHDRLNPQTSGGDNLTLDEIKALLAKERSEHEHLVITHSEMKSKWDKQKTDAEEAERKAKEEQGKFKDLYDADHSEIEILKPRVERYETVINQYLEHETEGLSEEMKKLIPDGDPDKRLEWVVNAKKAGVLASKKKADGDGSPPPEGGIKPTTFEDRFK